MVLAISLQGSKIKPLLFSVAKENSLRVPASINPSSGQDQARDYEPRRNKLCG
jgi:hypothetical protein